MELREWLIILGLALVTLIVIDGVRRLKRQRRVPRLDQVGDNNNQVDSQGIGDDNWELPNGGARVVKPASYAQLKAKPKLQRQEHPGPSRVLAEFSSPARDEPAESVAATEATEATRPPEPEPPESVAPPPQLDATTPSTAARLPSDEAEARFKEPTLSALDPADLQAKPTEAEAEAAEAISADPADHAYDEDEQYRLVDLEGMGNSIKDRSRHMGETVQRFGLTMQQRLTKRQERKREEKAKREQARAEKAAHEAERRRLEAEAEAAREAERRRLEAEAIEQADGDDPLFAPPRVNTSDPSDSTGVEPATAEHVQPAPAEAEPPHDDVVRTHPTLARALRNNVSAERARETLSQADEVIVISVLSRDEEGFSGEALLDLMLACGLRYSSDMGIFHRFETEEAESELQFSMVNVIKPGTFPIEAMDEFRTPGITLLMPLPGAMDTAAAFEAMFETAMVIVRNLGGELKDENHSVMTAQTVEFARQRVQEFERLNRLNRYQVN